MDSVIRSFWFWLLIIGVALILTAILIAGGMKEMKGWTWGIFVVGCVLAILGVIFGFIAWSKYTPCKQNEVIEHSKVEECSYNTPSPHYSYSNQTTPEFTKVPTNIPQAKKGFSTTTMNLSSLAPES